MYFSEVFAPELNKIRKERADDKPLLEGLKEFSFVCLKSNSLLLVIVPLSTPATLEQSYVVCELHEKINMLFSFLRSHLQKKIIVFFACCKEVNVYISHIFL